MKKIICKSRKNILKEAVVLLITIVMFLSVSLVAANTRNFSTGVRTLEIPILTEGFEDNQMPPPGWTTADFHASENWHIVTQVGFPSAFYEDPHGGDYAAQVDKIAQSQNEWLISPAIELTDDYEEYMLSFWVHSTTEMSGGIVRLYVGEPSMFDDVFILPPDPENVIWCTNEEDWPGPLQQWREKIFDLTEYAGSTIKIAWQYFAPDSLWQFSLDDIMVFSPGPPVPRTTINIGKISGSPSVCAVVKNTGNLTAKDIAWSISMKGGIMDMIDVSNAGEIEKLRAGDEEIVICTGSFFGIGKVTIDVTIESESARPEKVTRSSTGFVFLFKFYPGV